MRRTFTGVPHDVKSEDFDIDSEIGEIGFESIFDDCFLFMATIAHISRHPKLWARRDPRTFFNVTLAGCFS